MLWRRAWDETKWRYLVAQLLMLAWAWNMAATFRAYLARGWQMVHLYASSPISENHPWASVEAATLNLPHWLGTGSVLFLPLALFAAIIGTGGPVSQSGGRGALFTLSLPVTRDRLLFSRVAVGLGEICVLALVTVSGLWIFADDHSLPEFFGSGLRAAGIGVLAQMSAFGLAAWLSTLFADIWRPVLLAVLAGWALFQAESHAYHQLALVTISLLPVPVWLSLTVSLAVGAAALLAAWRTLARRDF